MTPEKIVVLVFPASRVRVPRLTTAEAAGLERFETKTLPEAPLMSSVVEAASDVEEAAMSEAAPDRASVPPVTSTVSLLKGLVPVTVKVADPAFTKLEPPPPVTPPAKVVGEVIVAVRVFVPRATVDDTEALERLLMVALVVTPEMSKVALPTRSTPLEEAIAPEPERPNVPSDTVVAPV
jgi:hypothetical protein